MKTLGQIAYEAYCESTDWKSLVSGHQLPRWIDTTVQIQMAWHAAANAVSAQIDRGIEVD